MLSTAASGLVLGLSLIVVIGAQNAHVLRQGLRGDRVTLVVALCAGSDLVLIAAGTAGLGGLVGTHPTVLVVATLLGVAVLGTYAVAAVRRLVRPGALAPGATADPALSTPTLVATTAALTWLNPHVYLDTVVLVGSVAASHGTHRWWFAAGAGAASVLWFAALGFGARTLRAVFARPSAWRVFDAAVAVVMTLTAVTLLTGLGRLRAPGG